MSAGSLESPPPAADVASLTEDTMFAGGREMYVNGGIEVRMAQSHFYEQGPAFAWFSPHRSRSLPVRSPRRCRGSWPLQTSRMESHQSSTGTSTSSSTRSLTVYVEREPRGEWIGLDAGTRGR